MNLLERLASLDLTVRRSIELATHLGTHIPNETTEGNLKLSLALAHAEREYARKWPPFRQSISGYNCFGLVFASRRTALYDITVVQLILDEDGYREVPQDECSEGDIVVYYDETGPSHAAKVLRVEKISLLATPDGGGGIVRKLKVLSKFNDHSGEYVHDIEDTSWCPPQVPITRWRTYSPRASEPITHRS